MFKSFALAFTVAFLVAEPISAGVCRNLLTQPNFPKEYTIKTISGKLLHQARWNSSMVVNSFPSGPIWLTVGRPYFLGAAAARLVSFEVTLKRPVGFLGSPLENDYDEVIGLLNLLYFDWRINRAIKSLDESNRFPRAYVAQLKKEGIPHHSQFYDESGIAGIFLNKMNREGHFRDEFILIDPLVARFNWIR